MTSNNDQLFDLSNKASRSTIAVIDAVTQRGGFKGEELSNLDKEYIETKGKVDY